VVYLQPVQLLTNISWPVVFAGCVGASSAILANMISFVMIGKINERVREEERISYLWWGSNVRRKFKQLYPANRLLLVLDSCIVLMALSAVEILGLRLRHERLLAITQYKRAPL
jgi:hypothetical protein